MEEAFFVIYMVGRHWGRILVDGFVNIHAIMNDIGCSARPFLLVYILYIYSNIGYWLLASTNAKKSSVFNVICFLFSCPAALYP